MSKVRCPYCKSMNTQNLDTRDTPNGRVRRRKVCHACERRFTTYEAYIDELDEAGEALAFVKGKRGKKKL